ncbi:hypothetical protein T07_13476 [Trichinella nelsoni]|uniref:Uncharacterized protein n=1 Tax=Trichinella nelsoni TaxID=6336 RepID=A0A0V0S6I4_9BILA|nr:hypothetical protein T07_13476 [Trichinella nelsoni]
MDNLLQIGLGRTADCIVASLSTATLAGGFFRAKRVIDNLTSEKISTLHAGGDVFIISELNCQGKKRAQLWAGEWSLGMKMEISIAKISVMTVRIQDSSLLTFSTAQADRRAAVMMVIV